MSSKKFRYKRGEVYLIEEHSVKGSEQKKTRPWVLVGATPVNVARSTVLAIPFSTQAPEKPPLSILVYFNNGRICAIVDQLRALDKKRIIQFEGEVSSHEMSLIDDSLRQVLVL